VVVVVVAAVGLEEVEEERGAVGLEEVAEVVAVEEDRR
jgi:hypothetical protein